MVLVVSKKTYDSLDYQVCNTAEVLVHFHDYDWAILLTLLTLEETGNDRLNILNVGLPSNLLLFSLTELLLNSLEQLRAVGDHSLASPVGEEGVGRLSWQLQGEHELTLVDGQGEGRVNWLMPLFDGLFQQFTLLFMLFESTHIQVLFITALYLTHIFLSFLPVFEVHLDMLLQVGGCREALAALLTNKGLLLLVDTLVAVQVRLLAEPLVAVSEVTLIGFSLQMALSVVVEGFHVQELPPTPSDVALETGLRLFLVVTGANADVVFFLASHAVEALFLLLFHELSLCPLALLFALHLLLLFLPSSNSGFLSDLLRVGFLPDWAEGRLLLPCVLGESVPVHGCVFSCNFYQQCIHHYKLFMYS